MKYKLIMMCVLIILLCALIPALIAAAVSPEGESKEFSIKARQYAYEPAKITVNRGDEIHIKLSSLDVVHGFFLEGHDIDAQIEPGVTTFKLRHPSIGRDFAEVDEIVFTANQTGKFRFRCSHTCGSMHPFMQGEMIVRPNYPFLAGTGGAVGILISAMLIMIVSGKGNKSSVVGKES